MNAVRYWLEYHSIRAMIFVRQAGGPAAWAVYHLWCEVMGAVRGQFIAVAVGAYWTVVRISGRWRIFAIDVYWAAIRISGRWRVFAIGIYWAIVRISGQLRVSAIGVYWKAVGGWGELRAKGVRAYWSVVRAKNRTIDGLLERYPFFFGRVLKPYYFFRYVVRRYLLRRSTEL